ncbi:hypothetical protein LC607_29905 [Nostoc sp. CHAB 5824]|nr:hypothetical protein [Nostoc sp. CHAB 5824]
MHVVDAELFCGVALVAIACNRKLLNFCLSINASAYATVVDIMGFVDR